jgi:hypothetical protein
MPKKRYRKNSPSMVGYFKNVLFDFLWLLKGLSKGVKVPGAPRPNAKQNKEFQTANKKPINLFRFSLVLVSFFFAGLGQWFLAIYSYQSTYWFKIGTFWWGLIFFTVAVILFIFALRPWKYENLQRPKMNPWVEWSLFGLIMLIAAFFRIYQLDSNPTGIFMDQGFQGFSGLQIAHGEWTQPFFLGEPLNAPAYLLYLLAPWFKIFKPTQFNLFLFFACTALAAFPLIYWTFRQIAGPRIALITLYLLSVMRWHVNFSRNGFPTIEVPLYMFGTLSFLLYGYRSEKRWPFCVSAVFFALGLYTYQAYKIFPLLVLLYGLYEFLADRAKFLRSIRSLGVFTLIFIVLTSPMIFYMLKSGVGHREQENIINQVRNAHSWKPVKEMIVKTLLMFNREGDYNERHNIPNHRMLDDISGSLFVLGVFYALSRIQRRKYFYAIVGMFIMSLPCLFSVVPAHANRMLGTTPFICFLIAAPLSVFWGRIRQRWGGMGEILFLLILFEPLVLIGIQNYHTYFVEQPMDGSYWNSSFWGGYSYDASLIGKMIAENGNGYDYYLDGRHFNHYTVRFLTYDLKDRVKQFTLPAGFAPLKTDPNRGIIYAFLAEQKGLVDILRSLYPDCSIQLVKNRTGQSLLYYVKVPATGVSQAKGLRMRIFGGQNSVAADFPGNLPPGPYRATLTGCVYLDRTAAYQFEVKSNAGFSWTIGGHPIHPGKNIKLLKGFYRVEAHLTAPSGPVSLQLIATVGIEKPTQLDNSRFTTLEDLGRGLRGTFYDQNLDQVQDSTQPVLEEWDPAIIFYDGSDFPYQNWRESIHWKGTLTFPKTGTYHFSTLTNEITKVLVDGKQVAASNQSNSTGDIYVLAGTHRFQLDFQKVLGPSLILYWMPPDGKEMEAIPLKYFGWAS